MRSRIVKSILLVVSVVLLMTMVAAAEDFKGTKIRVALPRGYDECIAFAEAAGLAAERLGMELEVLWFTVDQLHDKLLIDYKLKNPSWDLVFVATTSVAEWMELGAIVPIGRFIRENPDIVDENALAMWDYDPRSIRDFTYNGEWVGPSIYLTGVAMHYRKDLLSHPEEQKAFKEKYGYELAVPKTYAQFRDIAEFFTRKAGEKLAGETLQTDFYGASHSNKPASFLWYDFVNVLQAFGAHDIYDPETMWPTLDSPETIAAAEWYVSLVPFMPPGHMTMSSGEATALFAEGKVALQVEYFQRFTAMVLDPDKSAYADKTGFTVPPSVDGVEGRPHAAHFGGNAVALSSLSNQQRAAYKLLETAMSADVIKEVLLTQFPNGGWVPPRLSVLDDEEANRVLPWLAEARAELLDRDDVYYFQLPQLPIYFGSMEIAGAALSKALAGEATVADAFKQAQKEVEELFREAGYGK